jgi:hypothetical protein
LSRVSIASALVLLVLAPGLANAQIKNPFRDTRPANPTPVPSPNHAPSMDQENWGALAPEQKFGTALESFWAFGGGGNEGAGMCPPGSLAEKIGCLKAQGTTLLVKYPQACQIEITERIFVPKTASQSWDGKVIGTYVIGRMLSLSLGDLDPELISKEGTGVSARFVLFFELTPKSLQPKQVLLSSDANTWMRLPPPPMIDELKEPYRNENDRFQKLATARQAWMQTMYGQYGRSDIQYFSISNYFTNDATNSEAGLQLIQNHREKIYVKLSTPSVSQAIQTGNVFSNAGIDRFVDAVKSVLAKCRG